MSLYQRQQLQHQQQPPLVDPKPVSPRHGTSLQQRSLSLFSPTGVIALLSLMVILGVLFPWMGMPAGLFSGSKDGALSRWREYTLAEAAAFVGKNGTIIVCAVSQPYLPFLNNWLISIARRKHQEKVLVVAEDYATLYKVNEKWPGHAVLIPPAPEAQTAHKFGSQVQIASSCLTRMKLNPGSSAWCLIFPHFYRYNNTIMAPNSAYMMPIL